jgi:CDP-paratose 2-epimerase
MWWISGLSRFQAHYPEWKLTYDVPAVIREIHVTNADRWTPHPS